MNSIPQEQNAAKQIERLAAQRQLYSEAKRLQAIHFALSVPCVVALAFVTLAFPALKPTALIWNLVIAVIDVSLLSVRQEEFKTRAARIQELFDCAVLDLPGRELKGTAKVLPEEVDRAAATYRKKHSDLSDLSNWYPVCVGSVPMPLARIICQRTNCWWDSDVRRRYANFLLMFLLVLSAITVGIGLFRNTTLNDLLVSVTAPLVPMWLWGLRQRTDQNKTAAKLDRLREHAEKLWNAALSDAAAGKLDQNADKLQDSSRELQDEIYEHRRSNQPIFDRIHKQLRTEMEGQMNRSAQQLTEQAFERLQRHR